MYNLCRILQHVVNGFDNVSLAQHHSVIERHQLVFQMSQGRVIDIIIIGGSYSLQYYSFRKTKALVSLTSPCGILKNVADSFEL